MTLLGAGVGVCSPMVCDHAHRLRRGPRDAGGGGTSSAGILGSPCGSRSSARPGSSSRPRASASSPTRGSTPRTSRRGSPSPPTTASIPGSSARPRTSTSATSTTITSIRAGCPSIATRTPGAAARYPLETCARSSSGWASTGSSRRSDLEPFEAGPLKLMINALSAPDRRPHRRLDAAHRRRRCPRPQHERLAAHRSRSGCSRWASWTCCSCSSRAPSGTRWSTSSRTACEGGPRPQEAGRAARARLPLHRDPGPDVRRPVGRTAVLPRRRPVRAERPARRRWRTSSPTRPIFLEHIASRAATAAA